MDIITEYLYKTAIEDDRLYAFKQAGMDKIKVQYVNPNSKTIAKDITKKFTTINDGIIIFVRN